MVKATQEIFKITFLASLYEVRRAVFVGEKTFDFYDCPPKLTLQYFSLVKKERKTSLFKAQLHQIMCSRRLFKMFIIKKYFGAE